MLGLSGGERIFLFLTQYRIVTDRQTDRQTDAYHAGVN